MEKILLLDQTQNVIRSYAELNRSVNKLRASFM